MIVFAPYQVCDFEDHLRDLSIDAEVSNPGTITAAIINCPIVSGDVITDRKSTFQPHLAKVNSLEEVK